MLSSPISIKWVYHFLSWLHIFITIAVLVLLEIGHIGIVSGAVWSATSEPSNVEFSPFFPLISPALNFIHLFRHFLSEELTHSWQSQRLQIPCYDSCEPKDHRCRPASNSFYVTWNFCFFFFLREKAFTFQGVDLLWEKKYKEGKQRTVCLEIHSGFDPH